MRDTIETIAADLARKVGEWLSQPDGASAELTELRERLDGLRGTLGAGATSEVLRALVGSEKAIRTSRQKEAATVIATALRAHGIRLEPGVPLKRVRKAARSSPAPRADEGAGMQAKAEAGSAGGLTAAPSPRNA